MKGLLREMPAQPAQWNLFIPFHRGEIYGELISSGRSLFNLSPCVSVANY